MTSNLRNSRRLVLALGLTWTFAVLGCGGKKSMDGAGEQEQVGTVSSEDKVARLAGEEEGVGQASFDGAKKIRRSQSLSAGSTKMSPGKKLEVTTKAGDTLWNIAARKAVYGSGWLYPLIYKANKDLIKDPNKLDAGVKLKIPRDLGKVDEEVAKEQAMTGQILDTSPLPGAQVTPVPQAVKAPAPKPEGGSGKWWLVLLLAVIAVVFWRRKKASEGADTAA